METLDFIYKKYNIPTNEVLRWDLPQIGRNDLAKLFAELKLTTGAEIGVESGVYSEELLKANEDLFLLSVDPWKSHRGYRDHTSQEKLDRFHQETVQRLKPYIDRNHILRQYSMDAAREIRDRSLDFVYIDANHKFVEVANDIHYWSKKVRKGGIVAGHDFTKYRDLEVEIHPAYVVPAFCAAYQIRPYFVIGGNVDPVKSWFFIQTLE